MSIMTNKFNMKSFYTNSTIKMLFKQEGKIFDRTLATMLYTQMDKTDDGQISEEEFVRVWINCESSIGEKIEKNNEEIRKAKMARDDNMSKL